VGEGEGEEQGECDSRLSCAAYEEIELSELFVREEKSGAGCERVECEQQCVAVQRALFFERRVRTRQGGEGRYGATVAVGGRVLERVVECGIVNIELGVAR